MTSGAKTPLFLAHAAKKPPEMAANAPISAFFSPTGPPTAPGPRRRQEEPPRAADARQRLSICVKRTATAPRLSRAEGGDAATEPRRTRGSR